MLNVYSPLRCCFLSRAHRFCICPTIGRPSRTLHHNICKWTLLPRPRPGRPVYIAEVYQLVNFLTPFILVYCSSPRGRNLQIWP
ncbi:hypothetical protein CPB86DRAFT_227612 [Serendipita vermifera]|nr:hypothetical protein CPB86DRAFT_227612 [Serendipita vermifera]